MNFLAHAFLSFGDAELLTGNMIADAIKGKKAEEFPAGIKHGILLHRSIDAYTDQHELVRRTRKIFYPVIHHYALVMSDVIYDHFLGVNWEKFSSQHLRDFSTNTYVDLEKHSSYFPEKFSRIFSYMKNDDWLAMYATRPGIYGTIERLSYRSKQFIWAKETISIFDEHYKEMEDHFLAFFPQLIEHSKKFLEDDPDALPIQ